MIINKNVDLSKMTTFHIGGIAKKLYIPESVEELVELLKKLSDEDYYIISGGSNLLINDKKEYKNVISMKKTDCSIKYLENSMFYVGCSNRIQKVINETNKLEYGGFEELYGLPALFGGIVYMNAGIGPEKNSLFTISDFIVRVKVYDKETKKIIWLDKNQCNFSHRNSVFHDNQYVIIGAEIKLNKQTLKISQERINKRLLKCKQEHEWGKGCFGTCFSHCNRKLLKVLSLFNRKNKKVYQSSNNCNWLVNGGEGTYEDAIKIIERAKKIHKLFHKKIKCEIIIWK